MKNRIHRIGLLLAVALAGGCGDDPAKTPATEPGDKNGSSESLIPPVDEPVESNQSVAGPSFPPIRVEVLDQAQESYEMKENTSFRVGDQGWQSYKASKSGYLTRFSLYGSAHTKNARFKNQIAYGDVVWGEIRLARTNEKLGTWSLSREEVVAQLKDRGLKETDCDWIDIRIPADQRIPQIAGETYLIQSFKISDKRPFFGSFRCALGDPYPDGAWWHRSPNTDRDLVFRTYVGKTAAQVIEERARRLEEVELRLQPKEVPPEPVVSVAPPREAPPAPVVPVAPPKEVVPPVLPPTFLPPKQRPEENNATKPDPKKPLLPFLPRK